MRPVAHPLLRALCSLGLLLGLGLSILEEMSCDLPGQGNISRAAAVSADRTGSNADSPAGAPDLNHCCPCIHIYTLGLVARLAPALIVDGFPAHFASSSRLVPSSLPEPLVPPPIV